MSNKKGKKLTKSQIPQFFEYNKENEMKGQKQNP